MGRFFICESNFKTQTQLRIGKLLIVQCPLHCSVVCKIIIIPFLQNPFLNSDSSPIDNTAHSITHTHLISKNPISRVLSIATPLSSKLPKRQKLTSGFSPKPLYLKPKRNGKTSNPKCTATRQKQQHPEEKAAERTRANIPV